MYDENLLSFLLAAPAGTLTTVYWVCLIVGGGMLLMSVLGGLGHSDVDVDTHAGLDFQGHADVDAGTAGADFHAEVGHVDPGHADVGHADVAHAQGAHSEAASLSTWLSLRFIVFFLAVFGAVGVVLTHLTGIRPSLTLAVALAGGALVGQGVHQVFRVIRRSSGNSTPQPQDYVYKLARVTVGIAPPDQGEVVLQVRGAERYAPATAHEKMDTGTEVVVVAYRAGVAQVVSRKEFNPGAPGQARPA